MMTTKEQYTEKLSDSLSVSEIIAFRRAFSARREYLIKSWVEHLQSGMNITYWANLIQECNDAEIAISGRLVVV